MTGPTCKGCGLPVPDGDETIVWTVTAIHPDAVQHDEIWHSACAPQVSPEEFILGRMPGFSWAPVSMLPAAPTKPTPKRFGSYLDRKL